MTTLMLTQEKSIDMEIMELLRDLPIDTKLAIKQLVRFMWDQARHRDTKSLNGFATDAIGSTSSNLIVSVPASNLLKLAEALNGFGYDGDALVDSEALYDEV